MSSLSEASAVSRREAVQPSALPALPPAPAPTPDWVARARSQLASSLDARGEFPDTDAARELLDGLVGDLRLLLERRGSVGFSRAADTPVRLRLIELLRAEFVRLWGETDAPPAPDEMIRILEVLDELRVAAEPGGRHRFELDLGDPSSLGLVVEMAHDLRSPLTSILFLAEVLRNGRSGELNELQHRQLGVIYSAAFALTSVADDLIDMSRRGQRPGREEPSVFSVAEVVEGVAQMLRPMAEAKGIAFRERTPWDERRLGRPVTLNRVLVNLATNALKFTEEGFVEILAEPEGFDSVRFTVHDSGRGIPREAQATLFDTFRKSRQRKGFFFSGSGLGLSMARRLVEDMGAALEYETEVDRGTRFFFTLRLPPVDL